jgi:hypothetical protein
MSIEWDKIGNFIQTVGTPIALLFLVVAPIVYALYRVISTWGPAIAQKHMSFLESLDKGQQTISDSISQIAATNAQSQINHTKTHDGIKVGIQVAYEACEAARKAINHTNDPELQRKVLPHIDAIERLISQR